MIRFVQEIRVAAKSDNNLNALLPYMSTARTSAGSILFRKDDKPDRMLVIKNVTVHLDEIGVDCNPGDVLGEIAVFTPDNRRTCTAICTTGCDLFILTNDNMIQLYYQNRKFGIYLMRSVVARLLANWQDAEARGRLV